MTMVIVVIMVHTLIFAWARRKIVSFRYLGTTLACAVIVVIIVVVVIIAFRSLGVTLACTMILVIIIVDLMCPWYFLSE